MGKGGPVAVIEKGSNTVIKSDVLTFPAGSCYQTMCGSLEFLRAEQNGAIFVDVMVKFARKNPKDFEVPETWNNHQERLRVMIQKDRIEE